ncbi:hypothetical protein BDW72DRAFT_180396 [Aspergillus terricola var. indicus]
MAQVYKGSYLTISALRASNAEEGFPTGKQGSSRRQRQSAPSLTRAFHRASDALACVT